MNPLDEPLDTSIDIINPTPTIPLPLSNPISLYNYFVSCYNHPTNQLISPLLPLPDSPLNLYISENRYLLPAIFIIMPFFPVLNLFFFVLFLFDYLHYKKCLRIHRRNQYLVKDPFVKMVFSKGLCEVLGKNNWFFSIEMKEIKGLVVNPSVIESLKRREKENMVCFMIYNEEFRGFYELNMMQWGKKARTRVLLSGLLCGISLLICSLCVFIGLNLL